MARLRVIRGYRNGSKIIRGPDKHHYHVNRVMKGGRISMRCILYWSARCFGRSSISNRGTNFRQTQRHNHRPDKSLHVLRKFRLAILNRCRGGDVTPFKEMYNQERRRLRVPRAVAALLPLLTLRTAMRNARHENYPNHPATIGELARVLSSQQSDHIPVTIDGRDNMYAAGGGCHGRGTEYVILMSKRMKRNMKSVKKVFSDGTFCTPANMECAQVWNLVTHRRNHAICLARVLMQTRSTQCYVKVLQKIKRLVPGFKPRIIMADFEPAQQKAWRIVFSRATRSGCFFHSNKRIGLKAGKLKLKRRMKCNRVLGSLVRSLSSIPLLPQDRIDDGMVHVAARAIRTGHWRRIRPLLIYMVGYWFSPTNREIFSGYRCPDRTSNICETDNAELQRSWREKHPSIWNFLHGVAEREDETYQDIQVLNRGNQPSRKRKASAMSNDRKLLGLWQDLDDESINVSKFLRLASRTMQNAFDRAVN